MDIMIQEAADEEAVTSELMRRFVERALEIKNPSGPNGCNSCGNFPNVLLSARTSFMARRGQGRSDPKRQRGQNHS